MKIHVGIATAGRNEIIQHALIAVSGQTRLPASVIICTPENEALGSYCFPKNLTVDVISARKGSCSQRNAILDTLKGEDGILLIIDDDFILQRDYLERLCALMGSNPDLALANGTVLKDGITGPGIAVDEAIALLAENDTRPQAPLVIDENAIAYGCNMAINLTLVGSVRFDENLPLYGWQEDVDFSSRLSQEGRIVKTSIISGVHLGVKVGRTSGLRFGYSQVINPLYLIRKGTMHPKHALTLMCRNLAMNVLYSIRPEAYIDRRGRLLGNLRGFIDLVTGKASPLRVIEF